LFSPHFHILLYPLPLQHQNSPLCIISHLIITLSNSVKNSFFSASSEPYWGALLGLSLFLALVDFKNFVFYIFPLMFFFFFFCTLAILHVYVRKNTATTLYLLLCNYFLNHMIF
jgi:hypothetical protein